MDTGPNKRPDLKTTSRHVASGLVQISRVESMIAARSRTGRDISHFTHLLKTMREVQRRREAELRRLRQHPPGAGD